VASAIDTSAGRERLASAPVTVAALATLYAVLDRLTAKGYLATWQDDPTAKRGGRRKLHFTITAPGQAALRQALQLLDALRSGTDLAGLPA
jgi:DNA-binding PadR family transcriptional regulator